MDIAEVLSSPRTETIDRSNISTPWSKDAPSHLDIIPGSSRSSLMDSPTPAPREVRRLRDALDKRTHQYDLVLIDCPPSLNGLTQMAMAASDRSLVVAEPGFFAVTAADRALDRKSTRLNSSHVASSYAVFCLKKKMIEERTARSSRVWESSAH